MSSDLPAVRIYLELAVERLSDEDELSKDIRLALGMIVRAIDQTERKASSPVTILKKRIFNLTH